MNGGKYNMPRKKKDKKIQEYVYDLAKAKEGVIPKKYHLGDDGYYWDIRPVGSPGSTNCYTAWVPAPDWAGNINAYLFEGPNIIVKAQTKPICDVPPMKAGGRPLDNGNFILTDEEKNELLRTDPVAEKFIRPYMAGKDFLYNIPRWCIWLKDVEPADIRKCPRVLRRIEACRDYRLESPKAVTQKLAEAPFLFAEITECQKCHQRLEDMSRWLGCRVM